MRSASTIQLYHCSTKAAINNTNMNRHVCVPVRIYLQKQVEDQIWPEDYNLLSPGLGNRIQASQHSPKATGPLASQDLDINSVRPNNSLKTASAVVSRTPVRSWKELSQLLKDHYNWPKLWKEVKECQFLPVF